MRTLNMEEAMNVQGGELTCSAGTSGVNCSGTLSDWGNAYDSAVDWTSRNVIEPVANFFKSL